MSNLEQARIFAQAGARVLDSIEFFKGWREDIDKEELDMSSAYQCIVGQATKARMDRDWDACVPYDEGWDYIYEEQETYASDSDLGFVADDDKDVTYDDLQQAWLELLEQELNTTP